MNAVILSIGTELVCGLRLDTHAADIARAVTAIGVDVARHETLDDDTGAIAAALRRAADEADVVIATGGLGAGAGPGGRPVQPRPDPPA